MQNEIRILSLNRADEQLIEIGNKRVPTGIFKQPVKAVTISEFGVVGDTVADTEHHGGVDQAVYLYSSADYAYWSETLQRELPHGTFGENITLTAFGSAFPYIGDRIQLGEVLLEVTAGRIPCSKLAAKMGIPTFVKQFAAAGRPGLYTRVLNGGTIRCGDAVIWLPAADDNPRVNDVIDLYYAKEPNATMLERALNSPIAERSRRAFQQRLAQLHG